MKANQILGLIVTVLAFTSCGKSGSNTSTSSDSTAAVSENTVSAVAPVKKYQIKSGIITFDNDLMGIKRKAVLYFDDYGAKEAEERYDGDAIDEVNLCDGKMRYTVKYEKKIAFASGECNRGVAYKFDWDEISKADKEYKVKKLANVNVAGKDCQSYSFDNGSTPTTFAGWNNICLYQETKSQYGTVTMKAVKVEENVAVPAEKLQVPAGFEIKKPGM